MFPIQTRHVTAQRVMSMQRRLNGDETDDFVAEAKEAFQRHLDGRPPTGPFTLIFHGIVDHESDGPLEAVLGCPDDVFPSDLIGIRTEPAHDEAFTTITKAQSDYPAILAAYDAVASSPRSDRPTEESAVVSGGLHRRTRRHQRRGSRLRHRLPPRIGPVPTSALRSAKVDVSPAKLAPPAHRTSTQNIVSHGNVEEHRTKPSWLSRGLFGECRGMPKRHRSAKSASALPTGQSALTVGANRRALPADRIVVRSPPPHLGAIRLIPHLGAICLDSPDRSRPDLGGRGRRRCAHTRRSAPASTVRLERDRPRAADQHRRPSQSQPRRTLSVIGR